jgi:hypothetical protein
VARGERLLVVSWVLAQRCLVNSLAGAGQVDSEYTKLLLAGS